MNVGSPVFFLNRPCPFCDQGSSLCFTKCRNCESTVLICDEQGITFPSPTQIDLAVEDHVKDYDGNCPKCGAIESLRDLTGEELQEFGYSIEDYH